MQNVGPVQSIAVMPCAAEMVAGGLPVRSAEEGHLVQVGCGGAEIGDAAREIGHALGRRGRDGRAEGADLVEEQPIGLAGRRTHDARRGRRARDDGQIGVGGDADGLGPCAGGAGGGRGGGRRGVWSWAALTPRGVALAASGREERERDDGGEGRRDRSDSPHLVAGRAGRWPRGRGGATMYRGR